MTPVRGVGLDDDDDREGAAEVGMDMTSVAGATSIGNSTAGGVSPAARTCSLRHLNSMLAFTSCRRATIDTEAPGSSVAATSSRFKASGQRRRLPPSLWRFSIQPFSRWSSV